MGFANIYLKPVSLSFAPFLYPVQGLLRLLVTAEGGEPHVALARRAEADTWRADHIGTIEQGLEELP